MLQWTIVAMRHPSVRCLTQQFTFSASPETLGFWWNLVGMKTSWSLTIVVFWPDPPGGRSMVGQKNRSQRTLSLKNFFRMFDYSHPIPCLCIHITWYPKDPKSWPLRNTPHVLLWCTHLRITEDLMYSKDLMIVLILNIHLPPRSGNLPLFAPHFLPSFSS